MPLVGTAGDGTLSLNGGDGRDDLLFRHANDLVMDWLGQADGAFLNNYDDAQWLNAAWQVITDPLS